MSLVQDDDHHVTPSIAIHTTTVGSGPEPVAFLHGLFGQGKNFTQIAKALADDATSLLVDLPDHGRSDWTPTVDIDQWADAIAPLLAAHAARLGRPGVTLVGHSLGGKVAMRIALRHPRVVSRLAVVDISPAAGGSGSAFQPLVDAMQSLDLTTLASRQDADARLSVGIPDATVRGFLMQNLRHDHGTWRWQMNLDSLGRSLSVVGAWPPIDARFDGPVVWIAGQRSDYVQPDHAPTMRALFPRTRLVTLKDAGHWVHSEQPAAFTSVVRSFLQTRAE